MIVDFDGVYTAGELAMNYKEKTGSSYASFNRTFDKLRICKVS